MSEQNQEYEATDIKEHLKAFLNENTNILPEIFNKKNFLKPLVTKYLKFNVDHLESKKRSKLYSCVPFNIKRFKDRFPDDTSEKLLKTWLYRSVDQELQRMIIIKDEPQFNVENGNNNWVVIDEIAEQSDSSSDRKTSNVQNILDFVKKGPENTPFNQCDINQENVEENSTNDLELHKESVTSQVPKQNEPQNLLLNPFTPPIPGKSIDWKNWKIPKKNNPDNIKAQKSSNIEVTLEKLQINIENDISSQTIENKEKPNESHIPQKQEQKENKLSKEIDKKTENLMKAPSSLKINKKRRLTIDVWRPQTQVLTPEPLKEKIKTHKKREKSTSIEIETKNNDPQLTKETESNQAENESMKPPSSKSMEAAGSPKTVISNKFEIANTIFEQQAPETSKSKVVKKQNNKTKEPSNDRKNDNKNAEDQLKVSNDNKNSRNSIAIRNFWDTKKGLENALLTESNDSDIINYYGEYCPKTDMLTLSKGLPVETETRELFDLKELMHWPGVGIKINLPCISIKRQFNLNIERDLTNSINSKIPETHLTMNKEHVYRYYESRSDKTISNIKEEIELSHELIQVYLKLIIECLKNTNYVKSGEIQQILSTMLQELSMISRSFVNVSYSYFPNDYKYYRTFKQDVESSSDMEILHIREIYNPEIIFTTNRCSFKEMAKNDVDDISRYFEAILTKKDPDAIEEFYTMLTNGYEIYCVDCVKQNKPTGQYNNPKRIQYISEHIRPFCVNDFNCVKCAFESDILNLSKKAWQHNCSDYSING
uniref:CSON002414 protein n=1 Tax=Culicoides sonorensis TaxID=179676 RepID=A0A336MKE8_CULSO